MNKEQAIRLVENEAIFRRYNEKVKQGFEELKSLAKDDGNSDISADTDHMEFEFFCECSDENCKDRIRMTLATYSAIHNDRNRFIVLPNHQVVAVEKIFTETPSYSVVEKYEKVPENPNTLNKTDVKNV